MAAAQEHIAANTQMGANLVPGGATFRVWAPAASAVYICYDNHWDRTDANLLVNDGRGYWAGFVPGIADGVEYKFYVVGPGGQGFKRDPYSRDLAFVPPFPGSNSVVRDPNSYPWHDQGYASPPFNDLIIYQYHVGTFLSSTGQAHEGRFLDLLDKIDYLVALGVTAIQPLPVSEFPTQFSMGYNGTDEFSPEDLYAASDPADVTRYLTTVNPLLRRRDKTPLGPEHLPGAVNQLKVLVDVCHVYGIAVLFDVVYNHAGGGFDDSSIYFFDQEPRGDNNNSLYFTNQGWAGGLIFAFWKQEVRQFLIDNAVQLAGEYHLDGFRYDEVSVITSNSTNGWGFCQDLTGTLRAHRPESIQIAEHWPVDSWVVKPAGAGGAGFDATWDDGLRDSVRSALSQAAAGASSSVDMDAIARALTRSLEPGALWRSVQYLESHDEVYQGRERRIPHLADSSDSRSWYARSRARFAMGLLMTAPGIPMIFMGQEFLEDKQWSDDPGAAAAHAIWWGGLAAGDRSMTDFLRFTQDLIALRRRHAALSGSEVNVFHINDASRVITYQRWLAGEGRDIVVAASLSEAALFDYRLGFPSSGPWLEVFNSDAYDNWPNPQVTGNEGRIVADGPAMHGLPASASIVIPPNGFVVFARDAGD